MISETTRSGYYAAGISVEDLKATAKVICYAMGNNLQGSIMDLQAIALRYSENYAAAVDSELAASNGETAALDINRFRQMTGVLSDALAAMEDEP